MGAGISKGRILAAVPFFLIGAAFIVGALWLAVERLLEGLSWHESDSFVIGWLVVLVIFGGAFVQFAMNALREGHSNGTKPLISPFVLYLLGALFVVSGVWSALYGSINGFLVTAGGIGIIIYGFKVSQKRKHGSGGPGSVLSDS